jgi:pseudouridine-5'-phosphate glycosidase
MYSRRCCNSSSRSFVTARAVRDMCNIRSLNLHNSATNRRYPNSVGTTSIISTRRLSNLVISDNVKHALANNLPIVALESTIITHGMPYPQNIEVARQVENAVRECGAVPATIAIIDGVFKVGLNDADFAQIGEATNKKMKIYKASRRDLGHMAAMKLSAGTTVSATMILAHMAGNIVHFWFKCG